MARVTEEQLREYLGISSSLSLASYINDSHTLMDLRMGETPAYGEPLATLIEKNLAAHLYTIAVEGGGITQKKVGESSETYAKATGSGMASTRFGQLVLMYDPTGAFEDTLNNSVKKAQFRVA